MDVTTVLADPAEIQRTFRRAARPGPGRDAAFRGSRLSDVRNGR